MKPHKYMTQQGNTWTIRRRVPKDILDKFPKGEVWKSLKTGDLPTANSRYPAALTEIETQFAQARLDFKSQKPASLNTVDISWIAKTWFDAERQKLNSNDVGFENNYEKSACINELHFQRSIWLEESDTALSLIHI